MNQIAKDRLSAAHGSEFAATAAPGDVDPAWRWAIAVLAASLLALVALFWEPARHTVRIWANSPTFNHGFLILPIVGWLAWRRRAELLSAPPEPCLAGLAAVAATGLVWLLGNAADVMVVQQFALVGFIQAVTLTVLGWRAVRILAFPLFYLLFAVPVGRILVPHLQDVTAYLAVGMLRGVGIPVFIEGVFLSTPTGHFHVAEACSGIRFLIATIAFAFLYANVTYRSQWRRAMFVGLAFLVPVFANGVRAFGIVYLAYLTDNRLAAGVDHIVYGWIFFSLVTVLMIALGQTFREPRDKLGDQGGGIDAPARGAASGPPRRRAAVAAAAALIVAAMAPAYAALVAQRPMAVPDRALALPDVAGGWARVAPRGRPWQPLAPGADARALATYEKNGRTVTLFVAYFTHQRQGSELVGAGNRLNGKGWSRVSAHERAARVGDDRFPLVATRVMARPSNRMVWHWYWVGDTFTADPVYAKVLEAETRLLGGARASAAIALSAPFTELPDEAEAVLADFLADLGALRPYLERIADGGRGVEP